MTRHDQSEGRERARFHVRVPGFVDDEEIGLGDAITRATARIGIRRCGGCGRRAAALDRMVGLRGRASAGAAAGHARGGWRR